MIEDRSKCAIDTQGYEVVREEFFRLQDSPMLTFNKGRMYVNRYSLSLFPDRDYTLVLIQPSDKAIVLKPCSARAKDAVCWCGRSARRNPRHMRCDPLFYKIQKLMAWDGNSRYCIRGEVAAEPNTDADLLFFPLAEAVAYRNEKEFLPEHWEANFGYPANEKPLPPVKRYNQAVSFEIELQPDTSVLEKMNSLKEAENG